MAKPELGTKRLCGNCSAKFYDLSKTPITCPKCHTVMELVTVAPRQRPEAARAAAVPVKEEALVPETQDAEFVSLEEADAEASGKKVVSDTDAIAGDDDIEIDDEPIDDAALIEEQEESDDDVTDIIGEREGDEEEP